MPQPRKPIQPVKVLAVAIGLHSCILGLLMLCFPRGMVALIGFKDLPSVFFPSQSGVFLLILGTFYLMAAKWRSFESTILVSKAFAVVFLTAHVAFLSAPPLVWAAWLEDALMLACFAAAVLWRRRKEDPAWKGLQGARWRSRVW